MDSAHGQLKICGEDTAQQDDAVAKPPAVLGSERLIDHAAGAIPLPGCSGGTILSATTSMHSLGSVANWRRNFLDVVLMPAAEPGHRRHVARPGSARILLR